MTKKKISKFNSLHNGQVLAASVTSTSADHYAWVGVYPLDTSRDTTRKLLENHGQALPVEGIQIYRIRLFKVKRDLVERDASIAEPELEDKADYFAFGDESLEEKLQHIGILIEQLELPYKLNYPI
jgi:hypothetical protein